MQAHWLIGPADEVSGRYPQKAVRLAVFSFIALQCFDLLTTLAAFSHGGVELNPVVRSMMPWTGTVAAIVASKAILISLALPLSRRRRILNFANLLYAAIVVWNVAIILALR